MTKLTCGHITANRTRCQNPVKYGSSKCSAGHQVNKRLRAAVMAGRVIPEVPTVELDMEDVFEVCEAEELEWNNIKFHHAQDIKFDSTGNPIPTHHCIECGMEYPAKEGVGKWKVEFYGIPEECNRNIPRHRVDNTCRGEITPL